MLALALAACGDDGGAVDGAIATEDGAIVPDGARSDGGATDGGDALDGAQRHDARAALDGAPLDTSDIEGDAASMVDTDAGRTDLVEVSHPRELRGVWVATTSNIDYPSNNNLSVAQLRSELEAIVALADRVGLNAIFFQVRSEADAMYVSSREPWSRVLTGTMGTDPGLDPLGLLLELAHARGIEVHAWMNPYRGLARTTIVATPDHITRRLASHAITYNNQVYMDPASPEVLDWIMATVRDLLSNYDVDGLHYDDFFYPYPDAAQTPFNDDASFGAYQSSGGTMSRGDWRRANVNRMVARSMEVVNEVRPRARFGISPFGIHRPGMPPGIVGLDAYAQIYCDAPHWMREGDVDYLTPQLYWPTTPMAQAYQPLLTWWSTQVAPGRAIFAGNALYRLGATTTWTIDELRTQLNITRGLRSASVMGNTYFSYSQLEEDRLGVQALFEEVYATPALPPPNPRITVRPSAPTVTSAGGTITIATTEQLVRWVTAYRLEGASSTLLAVWPGSTTSVPTSDLGAGTFGIAVVDRSGHESMGVRITLP